MDLVDKVSAYLGVSSSVVNTWAEKAPRTYRMYKIDKRSGGGKRKIFHPSSQTKALQYALLDLLLNELPVHDDIAVAYRPGKRNPLGKAVSLHKDFPHTVRVDFVNFFPSIKPHDLTPLLDSLTVREKEFVIDVTFVRFRGNTFLGIGSPASPQISNAVLYGFDQELLNYANSKDALVCRYADDIFFSSNSRDACKEFVSWLSGKLNATNSPCLLLKSEKTRFMSRATKRKILGIIITPDGSLSIGRDRKREIRSLVRNCTKYELNADEGKYLQGLLAFAHDVEPSFLQSLNIKFGATEMNAIMRKDWNV